MSRRQKSSGTNPKATHAADVATRTRDREDPRLEAARRRLRDSIDQADTFEAIREIVTNLLGCEEIGLYQVAHETSDLLWSFGIDRDRHGSLDSFEQASLQRVLNGRCHIAEIPEEDRAADASPSLRVFVPIDLHGRTAAVLVMLRLLPQKIGLDQTDLNLVKLLSDEAGRALFAKARNASASR